MNALPTTGPPGIKQPAGQGRRTKHGCNHKPHETENNIHILKKIMYGSTLEK
jgi:hypothetical protein